MSMHKRRVRVQLLYVAGCPNARRTFRELCAIAADERISAHIERVKVKDWEHARALKFLGSPSVRVEGADIEPSAAARTTYGMACRTYAANPHDSGMPARDLIVRALRSARPDA